MLVRTIMVAYLCFSPFSLLAKDIHYSPSKVVYDVTSSDPADLKNILDRISMLQNVYNNDSFEASIIVVVHNGTIPLFKNSNQSELMARAKSLAMGDIIKFEVCAASARMQNIRADQLHGFISLVPMADAEIIKLQQDGYAYVR